MGKTTICDFLPPSNPIMSVALNVTHEGVMHVAGPYYGDSLSVTSATRELDDCNDVLDRYIVIAGNEGIGALSVKMTNPKMIGWLVVVMNMLTLEGCPKTSVKLR
eukprot:Lankesteria_metandrocarpae@DN9704_c0_g1_i1.p1